LNVTASSKPNAISIEEGTTKEKLYNTVEKVRSFVRKLNGCSNAYRIFLRACESHAIKIREVGDLVLDMKIRWNSSHCMVKRYRKFEKVIRPLSQNWHAQTSLTHTQRKKFEESTLDENEWLLLESLEVFHYKQFFFAHFNNSNKNTNNFKKFLINKNTFNTLKFTIFQIFCK
jgi:hypothetical protein